MTVELTGTVRGERVAIRWSDGRVSGSRVLLRRIEPLVAAGRVDLDDLNSVIHGLELVSAQRMRLTVIDLDECA